MAKFPVQTIRQRDVVVYTFNVPAAELVKIARVDRYGEVSDGVNRKYDEDHALEIAEAMVNDPDTVMLDTICGDLKGDWKVEDGMLIGGEGAYLSIDDGQHRLGACNALNDVELARWDFPIAATRGLSYEQRIKVFRQQRQRKPIDSRLDLAQRHTLGDWSNDAEQKAYDLILQLSGDINSPLRGMILLEETVKRPYEHRHRTQGINAAGLWLSLKSVMGKRSPLFTLSVEKRLEVARNMIFVASETWPKAWKSDGHILTTARGINAVLMLIVSGTNFRGKIGTDFRIESLRGALALASRFNWSIKTNKLRSQREITMALDTAIQRGLTAQYAQTGSDDITV